MIDRCPEIMQAVCDTVLPGRPNRWPRGSDVIPPERLASALDEADRRWIEARCAAFPDLAPEGRATLFRELEAEAPEHARRIVAALYRAYYTTPQVRAVVEEIGEAGPRERSPHFDDALLARMRVTQAGRRRS